VLQLRALNSPDITPSYHWRVEYMERALDAAPNAAVVLLLRSPMARAYSAYVHRLNWFFESCYRNGQCDGYNTTFQDVISARDKYIFPSYWSLIKRIESIFGDRLLVISLEDMIKSPRHYVGMIEERLNRTIDMPCRAVRFPESNSLTVPQFLLGRDIMELVPEAEDLIKSPDDVYLCCRGMPRHFADNYNYGSLKALEAKWMTPVDHGAVTEAFASIYLPEMDYLRNRLNSGLETWDQTADFLPKVAAPLSEGAAEISTEVTIWRAKKDFAAGRCEETLRKLTVAAERDGNPLYHRVLATMYLQLGRLAYAQRHADLACAKAPASDETYVFRLGVSRQIQASLDLDLFARSQ
jgi:Sulfotransferase family